MSPDTNSIENLWSIQKTKVAYRRPHPTKDLIKAINKEWNNLPNELALRLINSMKNRIEALINASGDYYGNTCVQVYTSVSGCILRWVSISCTHNGISQTVLDSLMIKRTYYFGVSNLQQSYMTFQPSAVHIYLRKAYRGECCGLAFHIVPLHFTYLDLFVCFLFFLFFSFSDVIHYCK